MTDVQSPTRGRKAIADRVAFVGFLGGLLFLAFLLGALAAEFDIPPYPTIRDASLAGRAVLEQQKMRGEEFPRFLWFPTVHQEKGLVRHDAARACPGYTLYTSGHAPVAILVDMAGREVHRWEVPFSVAWPRPRHVSGWLADNCIYFRRGRVFPNGDLLALYETPLDSPPGYGLAKLDRDGRVLWTCDARTHHGLCVRDDGTICALTHKVRTSPLPGWEHVRLPVFEEFVMILSPEGDELKTFSLFHALRDSPYDRPLLTVSDQRGDILHSNTVHAVDESFAAKHDGVSAGDLMVCLRNLDLIVVINPERESIAWSTTGPWHLPHDPDPLENGRIMIFDNCFVRGQVCGSRVLEFDPIDGTVCWEYVGSQEEPFRSDIRSCQELLSNGNVLIAESDRGRLFEVTREGEIVWEYINPVRGGEREELIPVVSGVSRYTADQLPFLGERTLTRHESPGQNANAVFEGDTK